MNSNCDIGGQGDDGAPGNSSLNKYDALVNMKRFRESINFKCLKNIC